MVIEVLEKGHGLTSIQQDDNHHDFNKLEKLHVKSNNDVSLLHGIFDIVFKSNTILNIHQLIVECSANVLVTDLLNIKHNDPKSRKIGLPNLKHTKYEKIRDKQNDGEKDNMIPGMKNIGQWLDILHATEFHGKNRVRSFEVGSTNNCHQFYLNIDGSCGHEYDSDGVGYDRIKNGCKSEKKIGQICRTISQTIIRFNKE